MATTVAAQSLANNTVYVRNLDEKVKIPDLVSSLDSIFSSFGTILEIVAKKNLRAKGQAFVVFEDAESAETAIEEIQGFELFDKPMSLAFARTPSDAAVKKEHGDKNFEKHKQRRLAEKEKRQAERAKEEKVAAGTKRAGAALAERPGKTAKASGAKAGTAIVADEFLPPNKILFLQNLPVEYTSTDDEGEPDVQALTTVFGRFEGFREVRLVPGRKGIAFVEYENEQGASVARDGTMGMKLGEENKIMKVTFQRQ